MNRQANMYRALAALAVLALLLVIAAFPLRVHAEGEVPSDPEPVKPPPIVGINTRVTLSEGDKGEIDPSGMLTGLDIDIPFLAEPPHYVEVVPQKVERKTLLDPSLAVPQRYQEAGEVTCGAAALGMALEYAELGGEGGSAPSTAALVADLRKAGLLYEVGTGVEELAYVAREHGYRGTSAFHGWTLAQLREQLEQGRPVVVALGANGQGKPGHFVTVTGISEDGGWVSYNDPTFGARTVPTSEFLRQWGLQGNSGLVVRESPLPAAADPMLPWMGLFGALSMMAVLVGRESAREDLKETYYALRKTLSDPRRMGLGGRLGAGSPAGGTCREPVYGYKAVQRGYKTVEKEVPVYETKQVKTGYKVVTRRVPNYVTRKIQVGMKRVTRRVPRYVEKRVRVGTKKVTEKVKVTRYRTEPYYEWKKETRRVPVYRTRKYVKYYKHKRVKDWKMVRKNGRLTLQPTYRWKRVPVYGKKKVCVGHRAKTEMKRIKRLRSVPYTTVETRKKRVPVYEARKVQDGYRTVNEIVPVYDFRTFQEGWKTVHESVPVYEEQRVQVGTKTVTEKVPNYEFVKVQTGWKETPPPPSTPTPTYTPQPKTVPTPELIGTPTPTQIIPHEPTPLNLTEMRYCDINLCKAYENQTYIGSNPYSIDDGISPKHDPLGGPWILMRIISLFNTIAGPEAYKRHLENSDPNVTAKVYCSQTEEGKYIKDTSIINKSGEPLKISLNIENSNGEIVNVGPTWVESIDSENFIFNEFLSDIGDKKLMISNDGTASIDIWVVASFTDPPLVRSMHFTIDGLDD